MESRDPRNSTNSKQRLLRRVVSVETRRGLMAGLIAAGCVHFAFLVAPALATDLVSVNIHGVSGDGSSGGTAMSTNGNSAAFYSDADDLVPGDTNQARDVFARDGAGPTERVSVTDSGAQANGPSQARGLAPAISADGNIVAFYSDANNLVTNDSNGTTDVFVRDRQAHTTTLVSVNMSGQSGNRPSLFPSVSADGRLVAFQSAASDLVPGDTNGAADIFVRDLKAGTTQRLCGVQPNSSSLNPKISGDGRFVAFVSAATNLDLNVTPGILNIFVCDQTTGMVKSVSVSSAGVPGNGDSMTPAISFNGRFVAFKSESTDLVPDDTNRVVDVFVRDTVAGTTERISMSTAGGNSNEVSFPPAISDDGRFVAFGSAATNLVPNDANRAADVFVRDRQNAVTLLVDLGPDGQQATGGTPDVPPAISGDGTRIGFVSFATNLVPNDHSPVPDVFTNENPFLCPEGTCPEGFMCVDGFCVPPPAPISKTPSSTPTSTPTGPTPTPTITATPTITPTPTNTPTPIHCIGTEDCPVGLVCVEGLCRVPTVTPTPQACSSDGDCTPPLVCRCPAGNPSCAPEQKFCQPAVSPTPTVTPTPIPTCSTDADCVRTCDNCRATQECVDDQCSPADRCVDGVCAPTRLCSPDDTTACIIDRETCLNDKCECGGDCNLDGFVFANEIAKMIFLLSHPDQISSDCPAGDFDQNGEVTGHEICNAVTNLGVGCPLGISNSAGMVAAIPDEGTLTLAPTPGSVVSRGQTVDIDITLGPEGLNDVATAQLDVLFDTRVLTLDPDYGCTVPKDATDVSFTFMPRRPDTPDNFERLRLFVADLDVCNPNFTASNPNGFGAGLLLTCRFIVNPTAPLGDSRLSGERSDLGDILGNQIPSTATYTDITVVTQTCDQDSDCPSDMLCRNGMCQPECTPLGEPCPAGTVCRTGACVPECTQNSDCPDDLVCQNNFCVPTCTPDGPPCPYDLVCVDDICVPPCTEDTDCPEGSFCKDGTGCVPGECSVSADCGAELRRTCVAHQCVCAGDCNDDGIIRNDEITKMVNIFTGVAPIEECPSVDINGDSIIRNDEVTKVVINFTQGCP